ncbi:MAG: GNAT family N-acetyltransferase [Anaerolineaceae bacterium]|nr:GNAT family N-acetyltransferase [Anaerolineaceae bacterium]
MTPGSQVARIQAYLRENARRQYEVEALPPFTLFFHPGDPFPSFSYAIPDDPVTQVAAQTLSALRAAFRRRGRVTRFEFFEAFAPGLPAVLRAGGFREEARQWALVCAPPDLQPAPPVPGLEVLELAPDSPAADLRGFALAQRQGFNPQDPAQAGQSEEDELRRNLQANGWQAYLGRIAGEPAAAAICFQPIDGICELAGVATRAPFRRRGIATYLTWLATRDAFARGAQTACLTAEDERAGQVYRRIGYQPFSVMLAFIDAL